MNTDTVHCGVGLNAGVQTATRNLLWLSLCDIMITDVFILINSNKINTPVHGRSTTSSSSSFRMKILWFELALFFVFCAATSASV